MLLEKIETNYDKYNKQINENFKNIENILSKHKINEFDIRVCCLEMRFLIENLSYIQLEKYSDVLSETDRKKYYQGNKIIKNIIQIYNPFITKTKHNIKMELKSDYNKYNINLETISSDELNKIYNILGKQLHAKHPFENNIIFDKTELEKIFSSIKNLKNQIGTFKNINSAKCCECKQKFLFQESLNIEKSKINKTKEFIPIYCPFFV